MPTEVKPVEIPEAWYTVLDALQRSGAQYLIAGSAADAIVEGNPDSAPALTIAPAPFRRNLEKLSAGLCALDVRARSGEDSLPFDLSQIVNPPAARSPLSVGGTPLDVIGSAVGDGEFSIRVWRTRQVE